MKSLRLVSLITVAGVVGCYSMPLVRGSSSPTVANELAFADETPAPPPIVQVREYWHSSVVTIVAWDPDDAAIGLRTSITRTGKLVGGLRFGDHRLYMTPLYSHDMGGFRYATVSRSEFLLGTRAERDSYSCFYGRECSPMVTVGIRMPDELLRANRDSLVVTFFPIVREEWKITLRKELIAAYLSKVDSVVAVMKKSRST
jgi:hypothetical protein